MKGKKKQKNLAGHNQLIIIHNNGTERKQKSWVVIYETKVGHSYIA